MDLCQKNLCEQSKVSTQLFSLDPWPANVNDWPLFGWQRWEWWLLVRWRRNDLYEESSISIRRVFFGKTMLKKRRFTFGWWGSLWRSKNANLTADWQSKRGKGIVDGCCGLGGMYSRSVMTVGSTVTESVWRKHRQYPGPSFVLEERCCRTWREDSPFGYERTRFTRVNKVDLLLIRWPIRMLRVIQTVILLRCGWRRVKERQVMRTWKIWLLLGLGCKTFESVCWKKVCEPEHGRGELFGASFMRRTEWVVVFLRTGRPKRERTLRGSRGAAAKTFTQRAGIADSTTERLDRVVMSRGNSHYRIIYRFFVYLLFATSWKSWFCALRDNETWEMLWACGGGGVNYHRI
jgi:hypothetical protein